MEFIDNTGHVFSLTSYDDNPIALQYTESDYIFWVKDTTVSINNYYIKPIKFIIDYNIIKYNEFTLNISLQSQFFKLIGSKYIQEKLESIDNISQNIDLDSRYFKETLTLEDFYVNVENDEESLIVENNNNKYYMFPFYVICKSEIEGTYMTNIMIKYSYNNLNSYTPITVGCTFIDECEELIINGKNMGIRLPKEIIKAIYNSSFFAKYPDEKLFRNKIKELLLNYMNIKGECGNFKSMYNSLKWFGWNNHIEISRLIKTDNEFQDQYILDYFNINTDIKDTFKYFNNTNIISLSVPENIETGEIDPQNYSAVFIGEGKPLLENLFDKNIEVIKDDITFYKPYYNFMFNELALKLDCLKYYYQQYFLPIHIKINRASIEHKVYANTIKYNCVAFEKITENPIYIPNEENIKVEFPESHKLLFCKSQHLVDDKFNEFSNYDTTYSSEDLYYINENCVVIPLKFINNNKEYISDVYGEYLLLDGDYVYCNNFYKYEDDSKTSAKRCTAIDAELYKINRDDELEELTNVQRFSKISESYFNCHMYLTATIKRQNDLGHYVFIDNEYVYKENFYKDNLTTIDESGNYINYYGKFVRINKSDRYSFETITLLKDNNFNYYQNLNCYYKNLIIVPRILNNKINWVNEENSNEEIQYRLNILLNNKWFYYDFIIITPNIYLELGKLKYKYNVVYNNDNESSEYYPFKQLRSLSPLRFNSFMYHPDLVTVDSLFKDENDNVLHFIDKLLETSKTSTEIDNETSNVDENKMYNFYKNYYANKIIIPYNEKYYNRIHLFNITKNENNIVYPDTDQNALYQSIFNSDLSCKLQLNEKILYDYYLMHDKTEWYLVVISQYPIGSYENKDLLNIHTKTYKVDGYIFEYDYSVDKFLINRMDIIKSNGFNHFDKRDLIVVTLENNNYQFNIDLDNKWEIQKIYNTSSTVQKSNTNIMIIGNNNIDNLYSIGYYNVVLNYTLNGLNNKSYKAVAQYKVEDNQEIEYPVIIEPIIAEEIVSVKNTISNFSILYEDDFGHQKITTDILNPNQGYHPIGIKIMNKRYFGPEQNYDIYIGLKLLSISDPDNGYKTSGQQQNTDIPYFGFTSTDIQGLRNYSYICYTPDHEYVPNTYYVYPQTDYLKWVPKTNGEPDYQAKNDRAYYQEVWTKKNGSISINILNDDDTLNKSLLDETCAAYDWHGKENTEIIINSFGNDERWNNWRESEQIFNSNSNIAFSPMAACAWRYHTKSTHQGDWYVPSFAEVFFLSYNFKRLTELFAEIAALYPNDCKVDLLDSLCTGSLGTGKALWTTTEYGRSQMWEIHPAQHVHPLGKGTSWCSFPYIRI